MPFNPFDIDGEFEIVPIVDPESNLDGCPLIPDTTGEPETSVRKARWDTDPDRAEKQRVHGDVSSVCYQRCGGGRRVLRKRIGG